MNATPESSDSTESIDVADLEALGFTHDTDPLRSANASLAQNYFFVRPATGSTPALRLNIARCSLLSGNLWSVEFSNATNGGIRDHFFGPKMKSAVMQPREILPTVQRFLREVTDEHTPAVHDGVYSPAAVAAYCEQMRTEIAERQKTIVDVPV